MGFLRYTNVISPLDFRKAVISLWFRIPQATVDAVRARDESYISDDGTTNDLRVLGNVAPLLMFGGQLSAARYKFGDGSVIGYSPTGPGLGPDSPGVETFYSTWPVATTDVFPQPSCLGVYCGDGSENPKLHFRLQMGNVADCTNTLSAARSVGVVSVSGDGFTDYARNNEDASFATELLEGAYLGNSGSEGAGPDIMPDLWHHLLISWDVSEGESVLGYDPDNSDVPWTDYFPSTSKLYCALDDVNINGSSLPANQIDESIPNDTVTATCFEYAGAHPVQYGVSGASETYPVSSVAFAPSSPIPASPIWIPGPSSLKRSDDLGGSTDLSNANQQIDLAYVQIFTGVTLDTSIEDNRRAFVTADGKPAAASLAQQLLGKPQDVLFDKGKDFIAGRNKGTAGNFAPIGTLVQNSDSIEL